MRTFTYTAQGQLATATDRGGAVYHYQYDKAALVSVVDPQGERRTLAYDARENLTAITFPDGTVQHTTYGANNLPATVTKPSGDTVTLSYNPAGRPVARRSSQGEEVHFTWDAAGVLTTVQDGIGTTQYRYDARGGFAGLDTPAGAQLRYTRDATGRLSAITAQATPTAPALVTQYTYDAVGNVTAVRDPLGGETRFTYDAANRRVRRVLPNGVTTTMTYDARDRLTSVVHQATDGTVLAAATYTRQATGEPTQIVWEDGTAVRLTYDDALRLTTEAAIDAAGTVEEQRIYTYDAAGNRLTRTTAAGLERLSYGPGATLQQITGPAGSVTYDYDPDGRVVGIRQAGATTHLAYSTTDQLTAVLGATGLPLVTYGVDGQDHRVRVQDAAGTRHIVVGPTPVESLEAPHLITDPAGKVLQGYVYVGDQPLLRFGPAGPLYYLSDAMGSVLALTDATGALVARFHYDGFGVLQTATGPAAALPRDVGGDFRFHGAWLEAPTGFYHMRARQYDPHTGRFLSRDPAEPNLQEPESLHPYVFAYGNPQVYRDPTGTVTLYEINTGLSAQNVLQQARSLALRQLTGVVRQRVGEYATNFFYRTLEGFLPDLGGFRDIVELYNQKNQQAAGTQFTHAIENLVCDTLFRGSKLAQALWFDVPLSRRGDPQGNGRSCAQRSAQERKRGGHLPNPDLLIAPYPPTDLRSASVVKRGYLVGDVKIGTSRLKSDVSKNQFVHMAAYARRYQYAPLVLYVVLLNQGLSEADMVRLRGIALRYGVALAILVLL